MVRDILAKWRAGDRSDRASILLPFLIISIGLGVLAWRSYQLSAHMELGLDTLAMQYAGYAADITARRVDSAGRNELSQAAEELQQAERRPEQQREQSKPESPPRAPEKTRPHMGEQRQAEECRRRCAPVGRIRLFAQPPLVDAVILARGTLGEAKTREFYTSSGLVRSTYDPARLVDRVRGTLREKPLMQSN